MTDAVVRSQGDREAMARLMRQASLDLLRPCPSCGVLIDESRARCKQCQDFADRSRVVTDADYQRAVADGLIVPRKADGA